MIITNYQSEKESLSLSKWLIFTILQFYYIYHDFKPLDLNKLSNNTSHHLDVFKYIIYTIVH